MYEWPTNTHIDFHEVINNGTHLLMHSNHNHEYGVPQQVDDFIKWLAQNFPWTHGIIYEQNCGPGKSTTTRIAFAP